MAYFSTYSRVTIHFLPRSPLFLLLGDTSYHSSSALAHLFLEKRTSAVLSVQHKTPISTVRTGS